MAPAGSRTCTAPRLFPGFGGTEEKPQPHAALGTMGAADTGVRERERKVWTSLDLRKSVCTIILSKDIVNSQ